MEKGAALRSNRAKYRQNKPLRNILLYCNKKIAEASTDPYWGTGVHLRDKTALNRNAWTNNNGGAMSEILHQIRHELLQST